MENVCNIEKVKKTTENNNNSGWLTFLGFG